VTNKRVSIYSVDMLDKRMIHVPRGMEQMAQDFITQQNSAQLRNYELFQEFSIYYFWTSGNWNIQKQN
jgi:hypothetical protein